MTFPTFPCPTGPAQGGARVSAAGVSHPDRWPGDDDDDHSSDDDDDNDGEQGRRHSVAVPVIPPPPGVKFEGGYHIEKNPINGAAVLVPPEGLLLPCLETMGSFKSTDPLLTGIYWAINTDLLLPARITFHNWDISHTETENRIFTLIYIPILF